eukprot:PhM_4_TR1292/c0_g1_i6/m.58285
MYQMYTSSSGCRTLQPLSNLVAIPSLTRSQQQQPNDDDDDNDVNTMTPQARRLNKDVDHGQDDTPENSSPTQSVQMTRFPSTTNIPRSRSTYWEGDSPRNRSNDDFEPYVFGEGNFAFNNDSITTNPDHSELVQLHDAITEERIRREDFLIRIAQLYYQYGCPAYMIERQLCKAARGLGLRARFVVLPSVLLVAFG